MKYVEALEDFTANDVNRDLFKSKLDKNEKGSMYRLFQAMIRENYLVECGKRKGLKVYAVKEKTASKPEVVKVKTVQTKPSAPEKKPNPEEVLIGKLREFVHSKQGLWNHQDWLWLINREDIKVFGVSESDIGRILEEEKTNYWIQRNG